MSPIVECGELPESDRHAMPTPDPLMMPPMPIFGLARTAYLVQASSFSPRQRRGSPHSTPLGWSPRSTPMAARTWFGCSGLTVRGAGNGRALGDGAIGAVRCPRSQDGRRTSAQSISTSRRTYKGWRSADLRSGSSRETPRMRALSRASVPDNWVTEIGAGERDPLRPCLERGRWAIDDVHSVIEPNAWSRA